jgi:ATP-dependent Clp protease, protease subunit
MYDCMQLVKPDVSTMCMGLAASAASFLLAGGTKGKRFALPYSRIMIHEPRVRSMGGQATDIRIQAEELVHTRLVINEILAEHTGQPIDKIAQDTLRDYYMSSEEALEYGLVDKIITKESR